jgi:hypothetical protein
MSSTDQFLIALQAYQEIQAELHQPEETAVFMAPDLAQGEPLPEGSLLLGMGENSQPLTIDLYDPEPGAILVAGDHRCGKTAFLQSLANATELQDDFQFAVITPFPEEWHSQESLPGCLGIWPAYHPAADHFLEQLISWANVLPDTRQAILLFVDSLELMTLGSPARQSLRWLLAHGPECHVWPVVTVNAARVTRLGSMLEHFRTRILGYTRRGSTAQLFTDTLQVDLDSLIPGMQFYYCDPEGCLKFWIPPVEGDE